MHRVARIPGRLDDAAEDPRQHGVSHEEQQLVAERLHPRGAGRRDVDDRLGVEECVVVEVRACRVHPAQECNRVTRMASSGVEFVLEAEPGGE